MRLAFREGGAGQQFGDIPGIGAGQPGDLLHRLGVGGPFGLVRVVVGEGIEADAGEAGDDFRMLLGEVLARHPHLEGRRTPLADFGGVGEDLAAFLDLAQRRRPDEGPVDVAATPGGGDLGRVEVDDLHLGRIDLPVLEGAEQAVVGG